MCVWILQQQQQKMYMSNKERELIRALISLNKDFTYTQQQRLESPMITLTWHVSKYKIHKLRQVERYIYALQVCMSRCFLWFSLKWIFETGYNMTRTVSTEL